jgi:sortase B
VTAIYPPFIPNTSDPRDPFDPSAQQQADTLQDLTYTALLRNSAYDDPGASFYDHPVFDDARRPYRDAPQNPYVQGRSAGRARAAQQTGSVPMQRKNPAFSQDPDSNAADPRLRARAPQQAGSVPVQRKNPAFSQDPDSNAADPRLRTRAPQQTGSVPVQRRNPAFSQDPASNAADPRLRTRAPQQAGSVPVQRRNPAFSQDPDSNAADPRLRTRAPQQTGSVPMQRRNPAVSQDPDSNAADPRLRARAPQQDGNIPAQRKNPAPSPSDDLPAPRSRLRTRAGIAASALPQNTASLQQRGASEIPDSQADMQTAMERVHAPAAPIAGRAQDDGAVSYDPRLRTRAAIEASASDTPRRKKRGANAQRKSADAQEPAAKRRGHRKSAGGAEQAAQASPKRRSDGNRGALIFFCCLFAVSFSMLLYLLIPRFLARREYIELSPESLTAQNSAVQDAANALFEDQDSDGEGEAQLLTPELLAYYKQTNADFIGWVDIADTNVHYPIVRGSDNDYYLTHTFKRLYSAYGSIYADYRCADNLSDANTVIYGHNMRNGTMFHDLTQMFDRDYLAAHDVVTITGNDAQVYTYRIFSVYEVHVSTDYRTISLSQDNSRVQYFQTLRERSDVSAADVTFTPESRIITFSTCPNDSDDEYRIAVHAVLESVEPLQTQQEQSQ